MPTASGASVEIRMTRTTAPDAISNGRPTRLCSIRISSGITAIASNARIAISPSACPWSPPALVSFSGRSGGIGDIARKTKALSTVGRKSNNTASRTATTGMITNIASNDRASRPGRRTKYNKSWTVVLRPKPTTVHTTLTCKASTTSCFRSIVFWTVLSGIPLHKLRYQRDFGRPSVRGSRQPPWRLAALRKSYCRAMATRMAVSGSTR